MSQRPSGRTPTCFDVIAGIFQLSFVLYSWFCHRSNNDVMLMLKGYAL